MKYTAETARMIFGQEMKPCPKCGSYSIGYQTPVKLGEPIPDPFDARKLVGIWARAIKSGATPLEGPVYLHCRECLYMGPSVDCSGRTSEDVVKDPVVTKEVKRLWNC